MASNPSAVDEALIAMLGADASLMAIATDGVYLDIAPSGSTRFVIVNVQADRLSRVLGGIAYEVPVYLVKSVIKDKGTAAAMTAGGRIDALLENDGQGGDLGAIAGYTLMKTGRAADNWRVRYKDPDTNLDDVWQHCGGLYEVWVQPT